MAVVNTEMVYVNMILHEVCDNKFCWNQQEKISRNIKQLSIRYEMEESQRHNERIKHPSRIGKQWNLNNSFL